MFSFCFLKKDPTKKPNSNEKLKKRVHETPYLDYDASNPVFHSIGALALEYDKDFELEREFKLSPIPSVEPQARSRRPRTDSASKGIRGKVTERPKSAIIESRPKKSSGEYTDRRKTIQLISPGPLLDYKITSCNSTVLT